MAGLTAADVPRLKLKWAFGFPGDCSVGRAADDRRRPRLRRQRRAASSTRSSAATGCVHWFFEAGAAVRAAISIGSHRDARRACATPRSSATGGNVYASMRQPASCCGRRRSTIFPVARVTGSPTFHNGRLYVGVASGEETAGAVADYECCRFRGSLVALDAATGTGLEDLHHPEEPIPTTKNKVGTQMWGPSGAPVWSSPAIDARRNALYVTTGNNYSDPPTRNERRVHGDGSEIGQDPVVASQMTPADAWTRRRAGCRTRPTAPSRTAPTSTSRRRRSWSRWRTAAARSSPARSPASCTRSIPIAKGEMIWQVRVGKGGTMGGVQWGSAADRHQRLRRAVGHRPDRADQQPGHRRRSEARRRDVRAAARHRRARLVHAAAGMRRAAALQPRAVGRGQRDSRRRVFGIGRRPHARLSRRPTANRVGLRHGAALRDGQWRAGRGGSLNVGGPAIGGGMLFVNSGYVQDGMPGNVLLRSRSTAGKLGLSPSLVRPGPRSRRRSTRIDDQDPTTQLTSASALRSQRPTRSRTIGDRVERIDALDDAPCAARRAPAPSGSRAFAFTPAVSSGFSFVPGAMAREVVHRAAVAQRHLDRAAARRGRIHQRAIGDELARAPSPRAPADPSSARTSGWPRTTRVPSTSATAIMYWQLTSGIERLSTMRAPSSGSLATMRSTLAGVRTCSRRRDEERVERRLNRIADRERLDRRFGDEEARAETRDHFLRLRLRARAPRARCARRRARPRRR